MILIILVFGVMAIFITRYMWRWDEERRQLEHERRKERFEKLFEILKKDSEENNNL